MKIKIGMTMMLFIAACIVSPAQSDRQARAALGFVLAGVGKAETRSELKATLQFLEHVREMDPGCAEPLYVLGRVYEALDVYDRAIESYEGYLELSADALDREEVLGRIGSCQQRQESLERDRRLMARGTWARIGFLPPVKFNMPMVSYRFRIGRDGRMEAQHPYLHQFDSPGKDSVQAAWSPVTFDGRFFEYEFRVYYQAIDPPQTKYVSKTIHGEVLPGLPCRVRQVVYDTSPRTPYRSILEGEMLHELR